MLKRSVLTGAATGLLVSLALIYPIGTALATRYIPDWQNPPVAIHRPLQLVSLYAAAGFFTLGVLATTFLVQPRSSKTALKAGALAGLSSTLIFQIMIISPAEGMIRMRDVLQLDPLSGAPTEAQLTEYANRLSGATLNTIIMPVLIGTGTGALIMWGLFTAYHLLRYHHLPDDTIPETPPTPPNLLHRLQSRRSLRWPDLDESTWRAATIGGLILGVFVGMQALFGMSQELDVQPTEQGLLGLLAGPGIDAAIGWLAPLTPIILISWGVLVLALQRNPSSRFRSRVWACTLAGGLAGLVFQVTFVNHMLRLNAPVFHLFMFSGEYDVPPEMVSYVPRIIALIFFGTPILGLVFTVLIGMVLGFLQGIPYAWLVPLVPWFRRPVDIGRRAYTRIERHPAQVLPTIYELFRQQSEPLETTAHLAMRAWKKKNLPVARLAAAYHTAITHPETADEAVQTIVEVLADYPEWRWRAEISELYRLLRAALTASEVADIAIIALPPEERTSSLPKPLAYALDYLVNIIRTLRKYERVDVLGGQILFLNNALDAIDRARDYVRQKTRDPVTHRAAYPEQQVLEQILTKWQTMVLDTIRSLRGRAELTATLETRRLPRADTLNLEVRIVNVGLNVAEDVSVQLVEDRAYQVAPGQDEREIEILLPGDGRSLEFSLCPTPPLTARLQMGVTCMWCSISTTMIPWTRSSASNWPTRSPFLIKSVPFSASFPSPTSPAHHYAPAKCSWGVAMYYNSSANICWAFIRTT